MSEKRIRQIERRIERIKEALSHIGPMRPGSLTRQYKDRKHKTGAYWQIATHKRFKRLVDPWIDLSIEHSPLTMRIAKPKATR